MTLTLGCSALLALCVMLFGVPCVIGLTPVQRSEDATQQISKGGR